MLLSQFVHPLLPLLCPQVHKAHFLSLVTGSNLVCRRCLVVKSFENLVQEGLPGGGWRAGHVEDTEMLPRSEVQISSVDARIWVHALCVCVCAC